MNITSPITGAAVTGLTTPTYTLTVDTAPSQNGKQWVVSAIGGTQTGVTTHSVSNPYTVSFFRPVTIKSLPQANPVNGLLRTVPVNTYKLITRKGAIPSSGNIPVVCRVTTVIDIPAGTDNYSQAEVKAMLSSHFGAGWANADSIATSCVTGTL